MTTIKYLPLLLIATALILAITASLLRIYALSRKSIRLRKEARDKGLTPEEIKSSVGLTNSEFGQALGSLYFALASTALLGILVLGSNFSKTIGPLQELCRLFSH
jgi:hypothetical protein